MTCVKFEIGDLIDLGTCFITKETSHVPTLLFWIHVSTQKPPLMYPHPSSGYISLLKSHHSCIHIPLLNTYLSSKAITHVFTLLLWVHISPRKPSLMYPHPSSGYMSLLKSHHSCIHIPLPDTCLTSKATTHVSTPRFWIHIPTQKPPLMYPHLSSGYISPLKSHHSCIHFALLSNYQLSSRTRRYFVYN
jgi:hypothetical protein